MNRHVAASTARSQPIHIGDHLREWRQRRHLSQLDLATDAEISTRHLSFVETGRAAPSREMVLRLASHQGWTVPMTGIVPKFSRTPGAVRATGAPLGAHTREVLTELGGVEAEELESLEAAGVIGVRR